MTPDQTRLSKSSMLTTSPACSARHKSSRIARVSSRVVFPSREISPDAGLTHQEPIRSVVLDGRSMQVGWCPPVLDEKGDACRV